MLNSRSHTNRVLAVIGTGLILSLFGDHTLYTVLPNPDIAAQADVTLAMVGVLLGINRLVRLLFNNVAGALYDRLPRRGLMIGGMVVAVVSTVCYAAGYGPAWMITGRVLWGIAWSAIWIGSNNIALDISGENDRGWVNGRLQMWFLIGVAVSGFSGGLFTDLFGYRGGLWFSAGLTALAVVVWLLFLPETRKSLQPAAKPVPHSTLPGFITIFRQALAPSLVFLSLRLVVAGVLSATTILWMMQFVPDRVSLGCLVIPLATLTGIFVALRVIISVISAPLTGRLIDVLKRRWAVMMVLFLLGSLGLWLMTSRQFGIAISGGLLMSISAGGVQAVIPTIIGDRAEEAQRGRSLGVVYTLGDLGSAIGPPLGLGLLPLIGIQNVYLLCAAVFALTAGVTGWQSARYARQRGRVGAA